MVLVTAKTPSSAQRENQSWVMAMRLIRPQSVELLVDCPDAPGEVVVIYDKGLPSELRFVFPPHVMVECGQAGYLAAQEAMQSGVGTVRELAQPQETSIAVMRQHGPELDS